MASTPEAENASASGGMLRQSDVGVLCILVSMCTARDEPTGRALVQPRSHAGAWMGCLSTFYTTSQRPSPLVVSHSLAESRA